MDTRRPRRPHLHHQIAPLRTPRADADPHQPLTPRRVPEPCRATHITELVLPAADASLDATEAFQDNTRNAEAGTTASRNPEPCLSWQPPALDPAEPLGSRLRTLRRRWTARRTATYPVPAGSESAGSRPPATSGSNAPARCTCTRGSVTSPPTASPAGVRLRVRRHDGRRARRRGRRAGAPSTSTT